NRSSDPYTQRAVRLAGATRPKSRITRPFGPAALLLPRCTPGRIRRWRPCSAVSDRAAVLRADGRPRWVEGLQVRHARHGGARTRRQTYVAARRVTGQAPNRRRRPPG